MVPKVDPSKFPEMLNAITENVRDSYAGMVFIDDPEDLASWGFTKEQLNELDSFAQKYGLTDVLEINEWNPDSKPDYILSAFSGLVDKIDDLQGRIRPKADDVSIENFIYLNQIKADVPEPDQFGHAEENDHTLIFVKHALSFRSLNVVKVYHSTVIQLTRMAISLKRSPSDRESTLLISLSFLLHRSQWIVDGARGHAEREPSAVVLTTK